MVVGVDFTKSNTWTGKVSFEGRSLHWLDPNMQILNPYQQGFRNQITLKPILLFLSL